MEKARKKQKKAKENRKICCRIVQISHEKCQNMQEKDEGVYEMTVEWKKR